MFFRKIDERILNIVKTQGSSNGNIECLIYAYNYTFAKRFLQKYTNTKVIEYPFINALGVKTSLNNIKLIAQQSEIKYISSIAKVFAQMELTREIMGIDEAQKKLTGNGVTVAVIDTGICENLDFCSFGNRILEFKDFVNNKGIPYDDNGHGTFVTGVLCGNGFLSRGKYRGVAPSSKIIMCKALDQNGETGALTILQAMQWIYDNRKKYNIKIVCMSFGSQALDNGDPLMLGAEALWNAGIVVVAAAGNSGPSSKTIKSPGISGKIITVGALDDGRKLDEEGVDVSKFKVASFSSRGPAYSFYKPDCVACGVNIVSVSCLNQEFYTKMSGTSVATPIIAGGCALLLEKEPNLTPNQVKSRIMKSCKQITKDRNSEGLGLLDINKLCG